FRIALKYFLIFFNIALVINIILYSKNIYPKLYILEKENSILNFRFEKLNDNIEDVKLNLAEIQQNDDGLYRPIFEIEPISSSIRMAGYGGTYNYQNLEGYKSSEVMIETSQNIEELFKQIYVQTKSYDQLIDKLKEKGRFLNCRPAIQPISDNDYIRISDYFGWRKDPFNKKATKHHGIDFAGEKGGEIYSTGDGIITKAGYSLFGYGRLIEIDHGFGYKSRYAHLDKIYVKVGEKVKRGQTIGLLGNSGRSTGPHLHYEVRMNNIPVNPIYFFNNDISPEEYAKMISFYKNN
ncbi:M23 family metallopeptidase, partial [Bacteroidota bacterium]